MNSSAKPKLTSFLFNHYTPDGVCRPIAGKPLIVGFSTKNGTSNEPDVYYYLGLEPVDYGAFIEEHVSLIFKKVPNGQLLNCDVKINCNRLYAMKKADLEALIDIEAHSLEHTRELSIDQKQAILLILSYRLEDCPLKTPDFAEPDRAHDIPTEYGLSIIAIKPNPSQNVLAPRLIYQPFKKEFVGWFDLKRNWKLLKMIAKVAKTAPNSHESFVYQVCKSELAELNCGLQSLLLSVQTHLNHLCDLAERVSKH